MTQEFDRAFRTDAISLKDLTGIFVDSGDPSVNGRDEPIGSLLLQTNGQLFVKTNTATTDWSLVEVAGSAQFQRTSVTSSSYTIQSSDDFIGVEYTNTGKVTLTLPDSANVNEGQRFTIKDEGGNAKINNITVQRDSSTTDTIDGDTDFVIAINDVGVQLQWTGVEWSLV